MPFYVRVVPVLKMIRGQSRRRGVRRIELGWLRAAIHPERTGQALQKFVGCQSRRPRLATNGAFAMADARDRMRGIWLLDAGPSDEYSAIEVGVLVLVIIAGLDRGDRLASHAQRIL